MAGTDLVDPDTAAAQFGQGLVDPSQTPIAQDFLQSNPVAGAKNVLGIDITAPQDKLQTSISNLPSRQQKQAWDAWAQYQSAKEDQAAGGESWGNTLTQAAGKAASGVFSGAAVVPLGALVDSYRYGIPYQQALSYRQARMGQFEKEAPGASFALPLVTGGAAAYGAPLIEGLGGVATPIAKTLIGGPMALAKPAEGLLGAGQRVLTGTTWGAAQSGGQSLAQGDDPNTVLEKTIQGGKWGTVLGAAAEPIISTVGAVVPAARAGAGYIASKLNPTETADQVLARSLQEANVTPEQVWQAYTRDQTQFGEKPQNIADTVALMSGVDGSGNSIGGNSAQRALRGAMVKDPAASSIGARLLNDRQTGAGGIGDLFDPAKPDLVAGSQASRVNEDLQNALGQAGQPTAFQSNETLLNNMRNNNYDAAFGQAEPWEMEPFFDRWQNAGNRLTARQNAPIQRALNELTNKDMTLVGQQGPNLSNDLAKADAVKQELDAVYNEAKRNGQSDISYWTNLMRKDLLDTIHGGDRNNPTLNIPYAMQRNEWSGDARVLDAIELGRNALNENAEPLRAQLQKLDNDQMGGFQAGLQEAAKLKMMRSKLGENATAPIQGMAPAAIIKSSATSAPAARVLGRNVQREATMYQTRNFGLGGSVTADKLQDVARLTEFEKSIETLAKHGPIEGIPAILMDQVMRGVKHLHYNPVAARYVAQHLASPDRSVILRALQGARQALNKNQAQLQAMNRAALSYHRKLGAVAGATSGAEGQRIGSDHTQALRNWQPNSLRSDATVPLFPRGVRQ
jgi:hypothetical protein